MVYYKILNYFSKNEIKYIRSLQDNYIKALVIISRTYRDKNRYYYKPDISGNPEIGHFIRVSDSFRNAPIGALVVHDENIILKGEIVGLLHDVVEDGLLTFDDLNFLNFPDDIISSVKILYNDKTIYSYYDDYITNILDSSDDTAKWTKYYDMLDNSSKKRIELLKEEKREKLTKKYNAQLPRIIDTLETEFGTSVYKRKREIVW